MFILCIAQLGPAPVLAPLFLERFVVLVDNDGGGIFSFLSQAEVLDAKRFELLFGTPHGTGLNHLAAAFGPAAIFGVGAVYGLLSSAAVLTLRSVRDVTWTDKDD